MDSAIFIIFFPVVFGSMFWFAAHLLIVIVLDVGRAFMQAINNV